jgi:antitoxin VapB
VTAGALSAAERTEKTARVLSLMDAHDLDTVVLRTPAGAAWWSGGGATHIVATPEVGVADLVLTRDGSGVRTRVVTAVNEAPRLQAEELGGLDAEWTVLPWNAPTATELPSGPRVGSDLPLPGCSDVADALTALRASLTADEVTRVEALGRDAAQALTAACSSLRPTDTEFHAAGALAGALLEREIDPIVLLVAGGERLPVHRHPLPTGGPLGELAMVVACARRHGLIVSLTRFVGTPSPEGADAFDRLLEVDAAVNLATLPGRAIGDVFSDLQAAYVEHGFSADEWTLHHQGGPAGYAPRDFLGEPGRPELVAPDQLFAWNPSARGAKSEDTVLAAPGGTRIITADPDWPAAREVRGLRRLLPLPYA